MLFLYTQKKTLMFYGHLIFFYTLELHTRNFEFNVIFVLFKKRKEAFNRGNNCFEQQNLKGNTQMIKYIYVTEYYIDHKQNHYIKLLQLVHNKILIIFFFPTNICNYILFISSFGFKVIRDDNQYYISRK